MISKLLFAIENSLRYIKDHPQLVFVLMLILVVPLLFLYTGQQFLDVGRANQDRLQKDRVGLLQDTFASLLLATDFSTTTAQSEIARIANQNPDILEFTVTSLQNGKLIKVIALEDGVVGQEEEYSDFYKAAAVRSDESLIFEFTTATEGRNWLAYRALEIEPGEVYFIYNRFSLAAVDKLFATRENYALFSLVYVYAFLLVLAYWHIRMTDYRYLYNKAQTAIATKDQFMNMMAHELRAPLTAMRGYASLIVESEVDEAIKGQATRISEATERLIAIVNDVLDVARIQSGKMTVGAEQYDVSTVIASVTDELRVSATEKGIELKHSGTDKPHAIVGDPRRLHQALTNLVSNAIKYTPQGSIELEVRDTYKKVEIRVKDTGTGISFEDQQQLFAPFFRVQSESVEKITGSGLGMWITKQLIELMGGTVAVESIKGVGTHLVVQLPKESAKANK